MPIKPVSIQLAIALLAGYLVACNPAYKSKKQRSTRSDTTVNTEAVTEHPYAPPPAVLSSQKGLNGSQVDLLKAQVNGDTLTVELQYKAGSEDNRQSRTGPVISTYAVDQVGLTDEATAKKYSVLKDQSGNYMASPMRTDQGKQLININIPSGKDKPVSVSFKFAGLPVDTKAVSITIPEVGIYKNVPLSR